MDIEPLTFTDLAAFLAFFFIVRIIAFAFFFFAMLFFNLIR